MIVSAILLAAICAAYVSWEAGFVKNETASKLLKDFVDVSPAAVLLALNRPKAALFLMGCLMANEFIYDCFPLGGALFAAAYASASVAASLGHGFDIFLAAVSFLPVALVEAALFPIWKEKALFKAGAGIYAFLSLSPCVYAFVCTFNFGFLFLALSDIGLAVYKITNNKIVKIAANVLYFAGICFVPLSL